MCIEQELKNLYGAPEGEGVDGKFSILVFKDFGVGTKFGQKKGCMLSGSSRKWHQKFGGHTKIHFSSYFYYYY